MIHRDTLCIAIALAGTTLVACASEPQPDPVRFTRGELTAADDLRVGLGLPAPSGAGSDLEVRAEGDRVVVTLFGSVMEATEIGHATYRLDPAGHGAAAAELWDRLDGVVPFTIGPETLGVTLDRGSDVRLQVRHTRMGEIADARLHLRVLVDREVVARAAEREGLGSMAGELLSEGTGAAVPVDVVLRTPGWVENDGVEREALDLSCDSDDDDPPPYDPCAGKSCGDRCTICDPADPDCVETSVLKQCQPDGTCAATVPECSDDCRTHGCAEGEHCAFCWGGYACIPDGAVC